MQNKGVQIAIFGREISGHTDTILGYKIELIKINDPEIIKLSGKEYHPILLKSKNDTVDGMVFEISESELNQSDEYEKQYKLILVTLKSRSSAFVYTPK